MTEILLDIVLVLLVVMAIVNLYFLWHSRRIDRAVRPRSPLLLAMLGVSAVVWLMGVYIAVIAARVLLALPPLPFQGVGLGIAILILELLPAFIWWQLRPFINGGNDDDS